jgi:hypothetical protein
MVFGEYGYNFKNSSVLGFLDVSIAGDGRRMKGRFHKIEIIPTKAH